MRDDENGWATALPQAPVLEIACGEEEDLDLSTASVTLAPQDCHVWLARVCNPSDVGLFQADYGILSAEERERMSRFVVDQDKHSYLIAHALARRALSSAAPAVPPAAWVFKRGGSGRPEIAYPETVTRLRFNISHTRGHAACVVTREIDCGVDVERLDRAINVEELSPRVLTPAEIKTVVRQPKRGQAFCFLRLWTLKEAYVKARGLGVALSFNSFAMKLGRQIRLCADSNIESDSAAWQFASWTTSTHLVAVAVRRGCFPRIRLIRHTVAPPLHP